MGKSPSNDDGADSHRRALNTAAHHGVGGFTDKADVDKSEDVANQPAGTSSSSSTVSSTGNYQNGGF